MKESPIERKVLRDLIPGYNLYLILQDIAGLPAGAYRMVGNDIEHSGEIVWFGKPLVNPLLDLPLLTEGKGLPDDHEVFPVYYRHLHQVRMAELNFQHDHIATYHILLACHEAGYGIQEDGPRWLSWLTDRVARMLAEPKGEDAA